MWSMALKGRALRQGVGESCQEEISVAVMLIASPLDKRRAFLGGESHFTELRHGEVTRMVTCTLFLSPGD